MTHPLRVICENPPVANLLSGKIDQAGHGATLRRQSGMSSPSSEAGGVRAARESEPRNSSISERSPMFSSCRRRFSFCEFLDAGVLARDLAVAGGADVVARLVAYRAEKVFFHGGTGDAL